MTVWLYWNPGYISNTQLLFTSLPTNKTPLFVKKIPLILQIKYMKICIALGLSVYSFLRIWLCELVRVCCISRPPAESKHTPAFTRSRHNWLLPTERGLPEGWTVSSQTKKRPFYFTGQISLFQSGSIQLLGLLGNLHSPRRVSEGPACLFAR